MSIRFRLHTFRLLRLAAALGVAPVLLATASHALIAQSSRIAVVEEFTNASCDPCVPQNANFQRRFLQVPANQERVIPIIYHTRFPGRDAVNAANPEMHNMRAAYYGVTGVPVLFADGRLPKMSVNGGFNGAPADIPAILRAIDPHRSSISPFSISVRDERNGADATAEITVTGTEALHDARLNVVLVERHRTYTNAGENGERDFFFIARAMLPNEGTAIDMEPGASRTFMMPWHMDTAWSDREIHVVAFLQRDDTREILQAATSRGAIGCTTDGRTGRRSTSGEALNWQGALRTNRDGAYAVTLGTDAAAWDVRLMIDGAVVHPGATVMLRADTAVPFHLTAQPHDTAQGRLTLRMEIAGERGAHLERRFFAYAKVPDVLLIARDEGDVFITDTYRDGLALAGRSFAMVERGDEDLFDWSRHLMVYEVGRNWMDSGNVAELNMFFERGGRMLIAGAEIAFALADPANIGTGYGVHDPHFLEHRLHAGYARDGSPSSAVYGRAGDPVGDGIVYPLTTGVQNQDTPDELVPRTGAEAAFFYEGSTSRIAGIRYADTLNRLIYLGFGLEGNRDAYRTGLLLRRAFDWLLSGGTTDVSAEDGAAGTDAARLGAPSPLPASAMFHLPFSLAQPSHVRIDLYDTYGAHIRTLIDAWHTAGGHTAVHNCDDLAAGTYTLVLRAGSHVDTRRFVVVR